MTASRAASSLQRATIALALVAVAACAQQPIGVSVRTFNRPIQLALVCLETATGLGRSMEDCRLDSSGVSPPGLAMHALVLQEARGEVAAVDLVARVVIDTDPAIPGYSFVPVAPLPVSIAVPTVTPSCAFVASAGASEIAAIDLRSFRRESASSAETYPALELPSAPTAMVLDPSEHALWVALTERSSVARVELDGCAFGAVEEIPLSPDVPPSTVGAASDDRSASRFCPTTYEPEPSPTTSPRDVAPLDAVARPAVLAVGRELLVGDRALPIVHRIDLETHAELAPFSVGATLRALAVTPEVPSGYDAGAYTMERFVYAIDDADGTVLAIDYGDPSSPSFGAVLPIGAGSSSRPDRIPFLAGARTLEIVRARYDASEPFAQLCDPASFPRDVRAPQFSVLRGVFLVAGLNDGTVRFVDVFDSDALCRGRIEGSSADCSNVSEPFVYIRRHHPRLGVTPSTVGVVANDVSFVVNGATIRLSDSSSELAEVSCPPTLRPIFGASGDGRSARVCGHTDPFEALPEIWVANWQGPLRGTQATGIFSTLADGRVALDSSIDACAAGVLGSEQAGLAPAPERDLTAGDVIAVTSTLTEEMAGDERCQAVIGIEGGTQSARPVLIPIARAVTRPDELRAPFTSRLLVASDAPVLDRATPGLGIADVVRCFGAAAVRFEVRVRDAYAVTGTRSGALHRVARGSDGTCAIDPSRPTSRQSRARPGLLFANDAIAFEIPTRPASDSSELRVTIGTVPPTLNLDVGAASSVGGARSLAMPTDLLFNDVYQRLYIVDVERRGLMETTMEPLQYTQTRFE